MSSDTLVRMNSSNKQENWYSEKYLKEQIELAFRKGLDAGFSINNHENSSITELHKTQLLNEFNSTLAI